MNSKAFLFWGLTVWLAASLQKCNAAAFSKGRFYSPIEAGSESLLQTPASGPQDTTSEELKSDTNQPNMEYVVQIPIVETQRSKEQVFMNIAENAPKTTEVSDSLESEFVEDGIEEVDENGIIRGKYVYLEKDGVPALIEYEAIPGVKFEVKNYQRGLQVGLVGLSKSNAEKSKHSFATLVERDPEYEHASVISRHSPKTLTRKTRTIDEKEQKTQEGANEYLADASYKFGFSADGQTRDEEADAQGNVQGSYSYIGEDGILTRVEYEAGSGKGFVVKKITQEDTKRSLEAPKSQEPMNFDQFIELQPAVASPLFPSDQKVLSEDHRIQTSSKKAPVVNQEQNDDEEEETDNEEKTNINQSNDGSYSFSYETPNQRREESIDSSGHLKSRFSFFTEGNDQIKQAQYDEALKQEFDLSSTHPYQAPKVLGIPATADFQQNDRQMYRNEAPSFSFITPQHPKGVSAIKKNSGASVSKDEVITQQNSETISEGQDISLTKNLQDRPANVDSASAAETDGSYSYSYETTDQMKQETRDTDGNVQGQYSYMGADGIRRIVHYKASPESGFTAEGSSLPSIENASEEPVSSNAEEVKTTSGYLTAPIKTFNPNLVSNNENPSTEYTLSKSGEASLQNTASSYNILREGDHSYSTDTLSLTPNDGVIPQQPADLPQVVLDISGIRRAVVTNDNGQVQKFKKVVRKRPITAPASVNTLSDGSYSFAYDNDDQLREESVDTKGNVYSNYQYKTNDGGRTAVVFVRRIVKGANENAGNILQKQTKRNIPLHYVNEDMSYRSNSQRPSGRRNWFNRKRHVQELSGTGVNQYTPASLLVSQDRSDVRAAPENLYVFQNRPSILSSEESAGTKNYYRTAKSIIRPFRGNAKYRRQIN